MFKKTTYTDSVIVRDVLAGNQDQFEGLVQRHLPSVFATALAHTRNRADAEDVVQDTFINAYSALDTLRAPAKFGPWILTIARNVARKHLRKRTPLGEELPEPAPGDSPDTSAQRAELLAMLSDAVGTLPEGEREVILLHYFSGKSARDVAQSLDISRSAVLKRLERGRARMGKHLLDRLGDKETLKDAMAPSVDRITRGVLAATVAWQGSKAAASGGVWATTFSVLPKASTVAASLVGVGFTAAIGWTYLSSTPEEVEAIAPVELLDSLAEVGVSGTEPQPLSVAVASVTQEAALEPVSESEPEPTIQLAAEPVSATSASDPVAAENYPTIDGLWTFTNSIAGGPELPFAQFRLSGQGGGIYITGGDVEAMDNVTLTRNGRQVNALLLDGAEEFPVEGEFNEALTEIVLNGSVPAAAVGLSDVAPGLTTVALRMIGRRVTQADTDRASAIEALMASILALFDPLKMYAAEHNGEYPEDLRALYPRYVANEDDLKSNAERTLVYLQSPATENLLAVAAESVREADPDELVAIEAYLEQEWGEAFMSYVPMIESVHHDLDVRLQMSADGTIRKIVAAPAEVDGATDELSPAAKFSQSLADNATCANNMKQLGLSCKLFEHEQVLDLFPGGWHMLYPQFLGDRAILTCPTDEPGTISYRLLYPATNSQYHREMAIAVSGLPEDTPDATLFMNLPFAIELDHCGTTGGRNVIFLDGHVARVSDAQWEETIAPYLAYAAQ